MGEEIKEIQTEEVPSPFLLDRDHLIYTNNRYKELVDPIGYSTYEQLMEKEETLKRLADELELFLDMNSNYAQGISAIQFGVRERMFAYRNHNDHKIYTCIEPDIPQFNNREAFLLQKESCLSFPGMIFYIKRPKKITVNYYSFNVRRQLVRFACHLKQENARVYLHELDHSDGLVIPLKAVGLSAPGGKELKDPNIPHLKLGTLDHKYIFKIPQMNKYDYYVEDENMAFFSNEKINPEDYLKTRITVGYRLPMK